VSYAYDAGDQAAVDNQAKEAARRDADDLETFRIWLSHPHGRDLLYRIIYERCHLGETFFAADEAGRSDTHRTYLHLGERNIGAWLDTQLRRYPELYVKMLQERQIDEEMRDSRLKKQAERKEEVDGGQTGSN
jgi:hypothetical protein